MSEDKSDFKEVKVKISAGAKDHVDTLDRTMLYSGVNIFGSLTQLYLANKDQMQSQSPTTSNNNSNPVQGGLAGASASSMMQIGNEVLSIFKKLQKRDSITKIKAFQELNVFLAAVDPESDELPNILTFFLFHMCRVLLNEQDKLVREAAHESFAGFIRKAKRKLGPHIKKIFPIWYCTFFDSSPEVARLAKANFESAFPPEKQPEVFKLTFKMFLHFADEQLQQGEDTGEDKKLSEENFDRITSCVFQALANSFQLIKTWSAEDRQMYERKMLQILQLDQVEEKPQQKGQKGKRNVWTFLSSSYRGSVRAACLQFVAAFITQMPAEIVKKHVPAMAPMVFSLIGEPNTILQTTLWREAIFTLSKNFAEAWSTISIKKDFLPKLYKCLKDSAFGASFSLYENFIKYVSVCPLYRLTDFQESEDKLNKASFKDRCGLLREAILNLYNGMQNDEAVVYHQDLVNSYCETLTFILQKRLQQVSAGPDLDYALKQFEKVIQTPVIDYVDNYQKMQSKFQNARNLRSSLCQRYVKILVDLSDRDFDTDLFGKVCGIIFGALNPSKRNSMRFVGQVAYQLLALKSEYQIIVKQQIFVSCLNNQAQAITKLVKELTKQNITDCLETVTAHRRLVYTLLKRKTDLSGLNPEVMLVGDVLQSVMKKEKMAKSVLTPDLQDKFKQLELTLTEIGILYLSSTNFVQPEIAQQEFSKILESAGLLEESAGSRIDPLEELIFSPGNQKVDQSAYFNTLRTSEHLHELIVGAISIKMLSDQGVTIYQQIIEKTIADAIQGSNYSILQEEDIDLIRTQLTENLQSDLDLPLAASYFQSAIALCCQLDRENDELRLMLIDQILSANQKTQNKPDEVSFAGIWGVFSEAVKSSKEYQAQVIQRLTEATKKLISSSKQSDVAAFNHLTRVVSQFVQLVDNKVQTLGAILLCQVNFSRLAQSCLPLKMFKDLFLQGGIGFDIQQLLATKSEQGGYLYVWFASTLLSIKNLTSLSSLMDLKRQLMIFIETEVISAFINLGSQQMHRDFIIHTFKFLAENQQHHSMQFLAKTMVDPGDQYSSDQKPVLRVDDFKQIYQETVASTAQKAVQINFSEELLPYQLDQLVIVLEQIGYFILDEASVSQLFKCVSTNIRELSLDKVQQSRSQLQIYMSLEKWLSKEDQTTFQVTLLNSLLTNDNLEMKQVAIELCSGLLEKHFGQKLKTQIHCEDLHSTVLDLLESAGDLACETTIQLCKVIRKTLDWSTQTATIISLLIQTAVDRAFYFDQSLLNLSKGMSAAVFIRPFEVEMLQELAETLLVFPLTLSESNLQASVENSLYYLLGCGFEALQKSGYVLLKFIYENFIPAVQFKMNQDEDLKQLLQKHAKAEESKEQEQVHSSAFKNISENLLKLIQEAPPQTDDQEEDQLISIKDQLESLVYGDSEEGQMSSKVFGYLLAWNAMLSKIENGRIKAQLQADQGNSKASEYMQVLASLTEFLETDAAAYQMLLVSLVPYLPKMKKIQPDLFKNEIRDFVPEYCNPKDSKQTQILCLATLINFMKSFPSLGRKFYQDCDRQLLEVMLPYIKSVVSPAILENEIKKIELSQLELGSNSDLTFVLFKSTKEVVATYNKTADISCKLLLKIPADYPLKSVQVDIGEQLKLKQTQLRRWTLSIRNLLQARNGDIITAILLWKTNIDKEMEGVEECFICYSVLHQSDKSLPSMQCKNCKNKFHVSCIRKWFNTSNKSNCPLCQTFFFQ